VCFSPHPSDLSKPFRLPGVSVPLSTFGVQTHFLWPPSFSLSPRVCPLRLRRAHQQKAWIFPPFQHRLRIDQRVALFLLLGTLVGSQIQHRRTRVLLKKRCVCVRGTRLPAAPQGRATFLLKNFPCLFFSSSSWSFFFFQLHSTFSAIFFSRLLSAELADIVSTFCARGKARSSILRGLALSFFIVAFLSVTLVLSLAYFIRIFSAKPVFPLLQPTFLRFAVLLTV